MSDKEKLKQLVDLLSEYESSHLLRVVRDIADGERFWEGDVGAFYNEYVKLRYFNLSRNMANIIPSAPTEDDGFFMPISIVRTFPDAEWFALPEPEPIPDAVSDVLARRRSRRDYSTESVTLRQLSSLLQHSCGVTEFASGYGYTRLPLRSFASSGGLQSPEIFLSVQAVESLPPGLYHYEPLKHGLESIRRGTFETTLASLALSQPWVAAAGVVFIITGYYERLRWKYGDRAYRYMCMDVGCLAENIYLAAEGLGLGVCGIAGFVDDAIEKMLDIDSQNEMALLLVTVGRRAPA